jgi:hypothetical protein
MKRYFTSFIILSMMILFITRTNANDRPLWIDQRPQSVEFYIGIGFADKSQHPTDYHKIAKENALDDLSSEITIHVSSETILTIAEKSGMVEEDVRKSVRSSTSAVLEGYDMISNWENETEYYVYYRLAKETYRSTKKLRLEKAISLALDFYDKGLTNEKQGKISNAFNFYINALNPIGNYLSEPLSAHYNGHKLFLMNRIYSRIQNMISMLEMKVEQPKIEAKTGRPLDKPLKVQIKFNEKQPVKNLPVQFQFIRGEGDLVSKTLSDNDGYAISNVNKITSGETLQMINAIVDLPAMLGGNSSIIVKNIVTNFKTPSAKFILNVSGPNAYLEVEETHFNEKGSVLYIEPKLKNALTHYGFSFSEDITKADIMVQVKAAARKGTVMHKLHVAWADINLSITDMNSGQEIYKNAFSNIKGINLDYEKAAISAFEAASKKIEALIPTIVKKL